MIIINQYQIRLKMLSSIMQIFLC